MITNDIAEQAASQEQRVELSPQGEESALDIDPYLLIVSKNDEEDSSLAIAQRAAFKARGGYRPRGRHGRSGAII
ncbi:MAG: hypothetical protein KGL67_01965 [Patescibacteria group bacterium]|nr:hypothetical protein [Patescibacteria group bacterium]